MKITDNGITVELSKDEILEAVRQYISDKQNSYYDEVYLVRTVSNASGISSITVNVKKEYYD